MLASRAFCWASMARSAIAVLSRPRETGGVVTGISSTVYVGYQEMHKHNIWDGVAKLATLAACVLVVRTSMSRIA